MFRLNETQLLLAGLAVLVVIGAPVGYGYWTLSERVAVLEDDLASTTALLQDEISDTHSSLSSALSEAQQTTEARFGSVAEQVGDISGTVGTLEKLAKTDPELLAKYSKVFFLNENYAPERVSQIDEKYLYHENSPEAIHTAVWPRLEELLEDAWQDDIELYVLSAYRSFDEQGALKGTYTVTYGAGTANAFSADQGYSEHQLGTTVDFITTGLNGQLTGFQNTPAYEWLVDNAHRYGFTLSYPQNNGYYIFEPWHWRYVGVDLATNLHNDNKNFYDLDQRDIDKYLVNIFE